MLYFDIINFLQVKNFSDSPVDEIVNDKQNIMIIFLWIIFVVGAKLY